SQHPCLLACPSRPAGKTATAQQSACSWTQRSMPVRLGQEVQTLSRSAGRRVALSRRGTAVLPPELQQTCNGLHSFRHSTALSYLTPQVSMKASKAASASFFVSAIQISCSARLAFGCWLFGSLLRTLAVLCTQQRWPRV